MSCSGEKRKLTDTDIDLGRKMSCSGEKRKLTDTDIDNDNAKQQPHFIDLKLNDQNYTLNYRINRCFKLQKLMDKYCERKQLDPDTLQFLYEGHRINKRDTPEKLGMKDGDEIDVLTHSSGGGFESFQNASARNV